MSQTPSPNYVVLKFGGTSVSTRARWDTIADILRKYIKKGERPFIVCSALSGISNALEKLSRESQGGLHEPGFAEVRRRHMQLGQELGIDAEQLLEKQFEELERLILGASLTNEVSPRLHARIMSMGEIMSTHMGVEFLNRQGILARWCDARGMLKAVEEPHLTEEQRFLNATCHFEPDPDLQAGLGMDEAQVFLTQGFIASNAARDTVLLGRGGSDTSAAYFAAKLQASRCEIWTDVPGMFTANPRQIPTARLLRALRFAEAQELASTGAKVLHPRCIAPVSTHHIPLWVRSTDAPYVDGTFVSDEIPDYGARVKAISAKSGITVISMEDVGMWHHVGFLSRIFDVFERQGLSVDLVTTSETNVTVSLDPASNTLSAARIEELLAELNTLCAARAVGPCAMVSLVGSNIRSILNEIGPALEVFDVQQVYMVSQSASDLNLSFVVDEGQADRLVQNLHAEFFTEGRKDELFGPSWKELFVDRNMPEPPVWWRKRKAELVELAQDKGPLYVYDEATLLQSAQAISGLAAVDRVFYAIKANPNPGILRLFEKAGVGFECVSPGEVNLVLNLFPEIDRSRIIFTPNFAPRAEYAFGFEAGVHVTLDNLHPLEAWPEVFAGQELIVRIDPGRGRGHHKYVRTAGAQSKFGVQPKELERLARLAEAAGTKIIGFHAHVGSGIKMADTWSETAAAFAEMAAHFPDVRIFDLGGGFGVVERPGAPSLDVTAVDESLRKVKEAHPEFQLWVEPGRYLVAGAGVLLARVTQTKRKEDVYYIGLETGMNSLIRPALYGAYHEIVNLSRLEEQATTYAEVVGPICETGDVLGHDRLLPEAQSGDVMLIATAGAYGYAMASRYNLREPAAEVLLKSA